MKPLLLAILAAYFVAAIHSVLAFVNNHFAGYAPETIRQLQQAIG